MSELGRGRRNENKDEVPIPEIPERRLADSWKEIHGQDDWVGMLDPMDPLLRSELYDTVKWLKHAMMPSIRTLRLRSDRYLHASYNINLPFLFKKSLRPDGWTPSANWMGYVAVSNDETSAYLGRRDITIAWRGTVTKLEWIADVTDFLRSIALHKIPSPDPRVKAESGFIHVYTDKDINCKFCKYSAREQILAEIKRLIKKHEDEELSITITGHSLGSALAIINAYDIAETGADVMTTGELCLVPSVPGVFFNEQLPAVLQKIGEVSPWCYSHVGVELALDHKNSPFLKETSDLTCFHNLEALLHLVDGYHGKGQRFGLPAEGTLHW
ncbi:hypothetical protein C3L33_15031, partial [Rhododendron williamsianum]